MNEDLRKLVDDVLKDRDNLNSFGKDEIEEYRKKINLYGIITPPEISYINISIMNWRDEYLRRMHITAIIGYLYRVYQEYKDELNNKFPGEEAQKIHQAIGDFLKRNFNYNPDIHVKEAKTDGKEDPERAGKFKEMREKMQIEEISAEKPGEKTIDEARRLLEKLKEKCPEEAEAIEKTKKGLSSVVEMASANYSHAIGIKKEINRLQTTLNHFAEHELFFNEEFKERILRVAPLFKGLGTSDTDYIYDRLTEYTADVNAPDIDDVRVLLAKKEDALYQHAKELDNFCNVHEGVLGDYVWIPPADVFYHFDRYFCNHYEQIREATSILYTYKSDIEFCIQYYDHFATLEEAQKHKDKIRDKVKSAVLTISNEKWTLLGPFKENRDRIDFYNKNTDLMKKIMEQGSSDQQLGEELMRTRIKNSKKKNIEEMGLDAEGLESYKKNINIIESLGAKPVLSLEEKKEMEKAIREKEMAEVHPEGVQVDVFSTNEKGEMVKSKFYTQADDAKPLPNAYDQMTNVHKNYIQGMAQNQKKLVSKSGKIMSLDELKDNIKPRSDQKKDN